MFSQLSTPVALVDLDVFESNIAGGLQRATQLGVRLRPHAKTVKSPDLMARVVDAGVCGLTVSTLTELETLGQLVDDVMYAVPVAAGKQHRIHQALGDADIRLTLVVDSIQGLAGVPDDPRIDVAVEIDCDGRRGGVACEGSELIEVAERVGARLRGVMTHAGGAYVESPKRMAVVERDAVVTAAERIRRAGWDIDMVSVGSSPTFAAVDHLTGVTEARPGVYLFGDESQVALGSSPADAVAMTVLTTVIGIRPESAIIDAGWSALSQDRGVPALANAGLGVVEGRRDLVVGSATQEHGIVIRSGGGPLGLAVGERLRIRPLHACATAEMHPRLVTVRRWSVVGEVERPRGW